MKPRGMVASMIASLMRREHSEPWEERYAGKTPTPRIDATTRNHDRAKAKAEAKRKRKAGSRGLPRASDVKVTPPQEGSRTSEAIRAHVVRRQEERAARRARA